MTHGLIWFSSFCFAATGVQFVSFSVPGILSLEQWAPTETTHPTLGSFSPWPVLNFIYHTNLAPNHDRA
jgi:hypothetical protein